MEKSCSTGCSPRDLNFKRSARLYFCITPTIHLLLASTVYNRSNKVLDRTFNDTSIANKVF